MTAVAVAVAVIVNDHDASVLVSQRGQGVHLAGKWEFPGGKLEAGETPRQALQREISEELGIEIVDATPILTLPYRYPEKHVVLHVFKVDRYHGRPRGRENQALRFASLDALPPQHFPEANLPIIRWLQMPDYYFISPEPGDDWPAYLNLLQSVLRNRRCLIQFRAPSLCQSDYIEMARMLAPMCQTLQRPLLLNCSVDVFEKIPVAGLHLSAARARQLRSRPIGRDRLLACSCHNAEELEQAARLEADLVVLSLVKASQSHPGRPQLGWDGFAKLCAQRPFAVYALGGMHDQDLLPAQRCGARGIAAIRGFVGEQD